MNTSSAQFRKGFSMVELLAVVAIALILMGLLFPTLARSRAQARIVLDLARCRQAANAVHAYASRSSEIFPVAEQNAYKAALHWYRAVIADGGFETASTIDPEGVRESGEVSFVQSMAMAYAAEAMRVGQTVPIELAFSKAVRVSEVTWPSRKGLLVQMNLFHEGQVNRWCCVTTQRSIGAVAWADASGSSVCWQDLVADPTRVPYRENVIGIPVFSTWDGANGYDR